MFAALNEQDLLCRVFGDCLAGDPLDREIGDLIGSAGPLTREQKLFTYVRYNAAPEAVQKLDSIDGIPALRKVGKAVADAKVEEEHFAGSRRAERVQPLSC
jgi:hypothetical protein